MYGLILCGGSGTRLWPLSRKNYPKQFLKLYSDKSMLQETYLRLAKAIPKENIFFITNKESFFHVLNQIKDIDSDFYEQNILIEPESKNTTPAILYGLKHLRDIIEVDEDEVVVAVPSDHYVKNEEEFTKVLKDAEKKIGGYVGVVGIKPERPETGYGYIKKGKDAEGFWFVEEFKEKPDKKTAEEYLKSGKHLWNSGKYIFKIKSFFEELKKHLPDAFHLASSSTNDFEKNFSKLPSISIDKAISEKSDNMIVFEGDFGWSDVGSFDSLFDIIPKKENEKHVSLDSDNVHVFSNSGKLIATSGVKDIIVVENNDSILIQKKGESDNVSRVVAHLKEKGREEADLDLVVQRPWGSYEVLIDTPTYKVKKIMVYPGAKLSLQSHKHRAEHWVVVKGEAGVVNGDKEFTLKENESAYIENGHKHRLSNPGKENLEIVEVQTGTYLGEDDITRYEDIYNR